MMTPQQQQEEEKKNKKKKTEVERQGKEDKEDTALVVDITVVFYLFSIVLNMW